MLLGGEAYRKQHHVMRGQDAKLEISSELPVLVLKVLN